MYLSRSYFNIVYLNLETINILYQNKKIKKVLEILIYEFGRIEFTNEEDKRIFEEKFNESIDQTPWILITKLTDYLCEKKIKVILIIDQFKSSSVDAIFYEKIEKKIK